MLTLRSLLLILVLLPLRSSWADEVLPQTHFSQATKTAHQPQVLLYRSKIYGDLQRFGFCATDFNTTPKPLIVEFIPGTYGRVERAARDCATL